MNRQVLIDCHVVQPLRVPVGPNNAKLVDERHVAKAEVDAIEVVGRREKMAQDKIGAAERAAITDLQNQAAAAAAAAARTLIAANHSVAADKVLVDQAIAGI